MAKEPKVSIVFQPVRTVPPLNDRVIRQLIMVCPVCRIDKVRGEQCPNCGEWSR